MMVVYKVKLISQKKINTLKPLVDKGKGLIKNSDSKPESFNRKFVNSPTEINY